MLFHARDDLLDDLLLGADLAARDEVAAVIHVEQGADLKQAAEHCRRLGDAPAADVAGKVGGEEPVVQVQSVLLYPCGELLRGETLVALGRGGVHQQAVTGGRAERIDDVDLPVGEALLHDERGIARGVDGSGYAGGQADMHDVQPLLKKLREVGHVLGYVDLRGAGVRALCHSRVELLKGHAHAEVVHVFLTVYRVMKADVMNVALLEMLLREVRRGAAAKNIISHCCSPSSIPPRMAKRYITLLHHTAKTKENASYACVLLLYLS